MKQVAEIVKKIQRIYAELTSDHIQAYAAYSALFLMMAFVPFLILLLTIIKHTSLSYELVISFLEQFIPSATFRSIEPVIQEVYGYTGATIISISAITALWSASKGALALTKGLNSVYHVNEHRNYIVLRLVSSIYTFLLLILFFLTLLLMVFGNRIRDYLSAAAPFLINIVNIIVSFRPLITTCVLSLFFAALYRFLPDRDARYSRQLPGAFTAALGWSVFSYVFSIYVDSFSNFSRMYGSLTAIVVSMLWLYFCMYIFFIGGAINAMLERKNIDKRIRSLHQQK